MQQDVIETLAIGGVCAAVASIVADSLSRLSLPPNPYPLPQPQPSADNDPLHTPYDWSVPGTPDYDAPGGISPMVRHFCEKLGIPVPSPAAQRPTTPPAAQWPTTPPVTQRPVTPTTAQRPATPPAAQKQATPNEVCERLSELKVGDELDGKVVKLLGGHSVLVDIGNGVCGYLPIMNGIAYADGEAVRVRVYSVDAFAGRLKLCDVRANRTAPGAANAQKAPGPSHKVGDVLGVRVEHCNQNGSGYLVKLPDGESAFLPRSEAPFCRECDGETLVGREITVRIVCWDAGSHVCSWRRPKLAAIKVGDIFDGMVVRPVEKGCIVDVGEGLTGFLPFTGGLSHSAGEAAKVRVHAVYLETGKLYLSDIRAGAAEKRPAFSDRLPYYEGIFVEFKRSSVFSPLTSAPDASQLAVISRTVASFANAAGGTLYIGVRDDGYVCGLDEDFARLGEACPEGKGPYPATEDGYRRRIIDALGNYLATLARVQFITSSSGVRFCKVVVRKAESPVFADMFKRSAWVRVDAETRLLRGPDLHMHIRQRFGGDLPVANRWYRAS